MRAAEEDFDPKTTMGKFTRDQMLMIAEFWSNQISDGWKEAQARRRRNGQPHTGAPRFGYRYERGVGFVPDPAEGPAIVRAYERFIRGDRMVDIVAELNGKGVFTKRGNPWSPTTLPKTLDTGFAAGLIREQSDPSYEANNTQKISDFDIWREGTHEPLITMEQWEAYKARRTVNARKAPSARGAGPHPVRRTGLRPVRRQPDSPVLEQEQVPRQGGAASVRLAVCSSPEGDGQRPAPHTSVSISNLKAISAVEAWLLAAAQGPRGHRGEGQACSDRLLRGRRDQRRRPGDRAGSHQGTALSPEQAAHSGSD